MTEKGFGFITPEGERKDVFFHASGLEGITFSELREGDEVEFETEDSDKGLRAIGVRLV